MRHGSAPPYLIASGNNASAALPRLKSFSIEDAGRTKNLLKILPVSFHGCYGTSSDKGDGNAKRKNTLRAGSNGSRRERPPIATQAAKTDRTRKAASEKSRPDPGGPLAIPSPDSLPLAPGRLA